MRLLARALKFLALFAAFGIATWLALRLHVGGLWDGLAPASAANSAPSSRGPANYDLTQLKVVNEVLKNVRDKYVDPKRVKPRDMLLSALNFVQRDVAQVIVLHEENQPTVKVRVDTQEREFRVDNVLGLWDVSARLREILGFVQENLKGTEVDLRDVEYAACNGMLHTLDPHSVLLSPEAYKEMNLSTSGQFGGLGIVISIRDQQLTVINPMPSTPAARAGVKKLDRIVKIGNESTLNMGLNEAVQHLRGAPGTKVTVWLRRDGPDGWQNPKPFELTREVIKVASVEHRQLEGNVGYVRIKQFQANTAKDLDDALLDLKKNGELKGLVLDLRGNPGGLLEQAARVADKFLVNGPIVATVGNPGAGEDREEKVAHPEGTEPNYPIALLVNGSSASASEIVAGALKNHDRAVVIGETTFGKGSVQLVFTELPDRAALKLTIAQYLTEPGDISIQGTGVTPDIELDPMTADAQEMDLTVDTGMMLKERDLAKSLQNARIREGQKPQEVVRYNLPETLRRELRERGGDPDEQMGPDFPNKDFPVKFARDVVAKLPQGKRLEQLKAAKDTINAARVAELQKASQDLAQIGIDWSDAPADVQQVAQNAPPPPVDVKVETDRANNEVNAGDPMQLKLTVTNKGTVPLHRLAALTKSDNGLYDNKELVIGKLDAGKTKSVSIPLGWCEVEGRKPGSTAPLPQNAPRTCRIPRDTLSRQDGISVRFDEARGRAPAQQQLRVAVKALERPVFAYDYQIADGRKGNGDGKVQKGEHLTMYVSVKNVGKGKSYETQANLRNLSGDGLLLHEGRFDISNMQPGEMRKVAFTFDVESALADPEAKVELSIADRDLRETVVEKVRMPIAVPTSLAAASGTMKAKAGGATLLESTDAGSRSFGRLNAGQGVNVLANAGDMVKVSLGDSRFGFVKASELEPGGSASGNIAFEETMRRFPPSIELSPMVLATKDGTTTIKGTTSDGDRLLDAYVFVGNKKIFYRSNRNGQDAKHMPFEAQVPLRPGVNVITVFARENPDTIGRKTIIVRKDGPNGELLTTPKTEEDLEAAGTLDD
ncbi:Carboxyl-terminal protease [Labilithrix luteola]|uniref:Carboxyl-terminal protease n=1 Tax=Labilithrix luteola TaxID=1391654 RepID=A0A0K1Q272_9BACT|nr:MXAN_5808 family serine peptidase [Labilithrix luteola]AKU99905.1 Carboxyl-terminal protease [Labilithrix luteola]